MAGKHRLPELIAKPDRVMSEYPGAHRKPYLTWVTHDPTSLCGETEAHSLEDCAEARYQDDVARSEHLAACDGQDLEPSGGTDD